MHSYLKSLGFYGYKTDKDIVKLLDKLQKNNKDNVKIITIDNNERWELKIELDKNLSLIMVGSIDSRGRLVREQAYPCLDTEDISAKTHCNIQKHVSTEEYSGLIDDNRVGISLIFRLSNATEYLEKKLSKERTGVKNIYFSAWTHSARVLLPIQKSRVQIEMLNVASKKRDYLIEKAKKGDEDAIESLSMEDVDTYRMVNTRIETEDLYSIVDTCFMPQGVECDIYSIIAEILEIDEKVNYLTDEKVYDLKVSCNNIIFHLAVNEKDIIGELRVGRRIKAKIWLQARVDFEDDFLLEKMS